MFHSFLYVYPIVSSLESHLTRELWSQYWHSAPRRRIQSLKRKNRNGDDVGRSCGKIMWDSCGFKWLKGILDLLKSGMNTNLDIEALWIESNIIWAPSDTLKLVEKHGKTWLKTTPSSLFAVLSASLFASRNTVFRVFTGLHWASGAVIGKDTLHAIVLRPRSAKKITTCWLPSGK